MINKPFNEITIQDIEQLKANEVQESLEIEYKSKLPGNSPSAKKEFLADISAFANAAGGDIIYGIEEKNGHPKEIAGIETENPDLEIRKYESMKV